MIYATRHLLVPLLIISSLVALYFLPILLLVHYLWLYCQVAIGITVVLIPALYLVRAVSFLLANLLFDRKSIHRLHVSN